MDKIPPLLDFGRTTVLDQRALSQDSLDRVITNGLGNAVDYLDSTYERSGRYHIVQKLTDATDSVFGILDEITHPQTQYVFSGSSTDVAYTLLSSRRVGLERYPNVAKHLRQATHLDSDQNQDFRSNGWSSKVKSGAIIIDEFAVHMMKAKQLLSNPMHSRKMVVFSVLPESEMWPKASELFQKFEGKQFFYGSSDWSLAKFMSNLAGMVSTIRDINGRFGILHDNTRKKIRWDRSQLSPEHEGIVAHAEEVEQKWMSTLSDELSG